MSPTVTYQSPQFLFYGLTFLMLTPSPLQDALLGPPIPKKASLPNDPLPPFDEVDPDVVQSIKDVLGSLGFQNPDYVWTQFGTYLVHLTQNGIRDTQRAVLYDVLDTEYIGEPPCPPGSDTQALVKALEGLAGAQPNPALMQRIRKRRKTGRGRNAGEKRA
jgi:hypothetical protein